MLVKTSLTASLPLCAPGVADFDVACVWQWLLRNNWVWGRRGGLADEHVFLMQLSVSLVGGGACQAACGDIRHG